MEASINEALSACILSSRARFGFDLRVRGFDQRSERPRVDFGARPKLHVAHVLSSTFEQSGGIRKVCAEEEADIDVRRKCIDVTKRRVAYARGGMAVVEELAHVAPALAHALVPGARDRAELACSAPEPCINRRVPRDSARESQQWHSSTGHDGQ